MVDLGSDIYFLTNGEDCGEHLLMGKGGIKGDRTKAAFTKPELPPSEARIKSTKPQTTKKTAEKKKSKAARAFKRHIN